MAMEPFDLEEFLAILVSMFQVEATPYLHDVKSFRADPKEPLQMLGTRFDTIAVPLEGANLKSSRILAISPMKH